MFTENYRLQSKYENHLIAKVALFQFVNSFLSLFYIAFYLRDQEKLKEQLAGLLISRQIIGNLRESAFPYFMEQCKLAKLSFSMWGALSPTQETAFEQTINGDSKVTNSNVSQVTFISWSLLFFSFACRKMMISKIHVLERRNVTLDKLKSKAPITNTVGHFPIIWRCWCKWDMWFCFQLPSH